MTDLSTPQGRAMHVLKLYAALYNGMSKAFNAIKITEPSSHFEMKMHRQLIDNFDEHLKNQDYWDLCEIACGDEVWRKDSENS